MTHTFAIYGDIGGWFTPFIRALVEIGVDPNIEVSPEIGFIPDDLTIIQLGDLVHRGPDSEELVWFVDELLQQNKDRDIPAWIQLYGNHEGHHLGDGAPQFCEPGTIEPYELNPKAERTLQRWRKEGSANIAVALRTDDFGDVLITHSGLSYPFWRQFLLSDTIEDITAELNNLPTALAFKPGPMLRERGYGGPVWTAAPDLYYFWLNRILPFSQVHGHSSAYWWNARKYGSSVTPEIKAKMILDHEAHHECFANGGKFILGIDPCFGKDKPHFPIVPWLVTGEVLA